MIIENINTCERKLMEQFEKGNELQERIKENLERV
jgi:hypothetical protein